MDSDEFIYYASLFLETWDLLLLLLAPKHIHMRFQYISSWIQTNSTVQTGARICSSIFHQIITHTISFNNYSMQWEKNYSTPITRWLGKWIFCISNFTFHHIKVLKKNIYDSPNHTLLDNVYKKLVIYVFISIKYKLIKCKIVFFYKPYFHIFMIIWKMQCVCVCVCNMQASSLLFWHLCL